VRKPKRLVLGSALAASITVGVLAGGCGGGGPSGTPRSSTSSSVSSVNVDAGENLVIQALANALKEPSLHYDSVGTFSGGPDSPSRLEIVGNVSGQYGSQVITWDTPAGSGVATVELVANEAYFHTSSLSMLEHYFGFPAAAAAKVAGRWVEASPSDTSEFQALSADLTVSSSIEEIANTGPYSAVTRARLGSMTVQEVHAFVAASQTGGGQNAPTTFAITTSQLPLPVEVTTSTTVDGTSVTNVSTYGSWGEVVNVAPPATAVPYDSLMGGSDTA
jgi:hypothetical protein